MRIINLIVVHCSATREDCALSPEALDAMHRRRGFAGTGYHYYIRRDGTLHLTRSLERIGAHAKGFNANSVGICYEGGLDCRGRPADTRTAAQRTALRRLIGQLQEAFPGCRVCGHRDLSPDRNGNGVIEPDEWTKRCPCFDAEKEYGENVPECAGSTSKQPFKEQKGGKLWQ
ncbi:N-acetylmuramoyl-L-alanine amidase [Bacteroides pyogenes]|uniref:N-acetylmuramoyl-L-alanine amidase n=1 Tax=Bacteroides pyogenes TaxID=310300 RepID=UPI002A80A528|nr:N-acetylmuramoyl-L-alanine amidase [Bacteroides pyogenes]MDY4250316.1 N-acetylmuramoyl-L-alanine amidase [Bacteroides pyogenes]